MNARPPKVFHRPSVGHDYPSGPCLLIHPASQPSQQATCLIFGALEPNTQSRSNSEIVRLG